MIRAMPERKRFFAVDPFPKEGLLGLPNSFIDWARIYAVHIWLQYGQKIDLLCMRVEDVLFTHYKTDVVPV